MRRNLVRKSSWERFLNSKIGTLGPNDTISRMPETILHQIISFLPNTDKKRIRFLSRTWRRLNAQNQHTLWLTGRRLSALELLQILSDDFHSVEYLTLTKCSGIRNLELVNFKLITIDLNYCGGLRTLYLNTPLLQTFHFRGTCARPSRITFGNCKELRILKLGGVAMHNMDCNISFPLLQVLSLSSCDMSGNINISSDSLECLYLSRLKNPGDITIDAPNLHYFNYYGNTMIPVINMNFPKVDLAVIELKPRRYQKRNEQWFIGLINMLQCLRTAKMVTFGTNSDKNIVVPKGLREILVPPVTEFLYINIKTSSRSSNAIDLSDGMLWICPRVHSLTFDSINWEFFLELEHRSSTHDNSCSFCSAHTTRCWRHSVTHYSLGHSSDVSSEKMVSYIAENLEKVGRTAMQWD